MRPARPTATDGGQAAVELALVLPLLAVLVLGLVQTGLIVRDQVLVVHAAREAARAVAVREDGGDGAGPPSAAGPVARRAALAAAAPTLHPEDLTVDVAEGAGQVRVRVSYRARLGVPLLEITRRYVLLAAFAQMTREKN